MYNINSDLIARPNDRCFLDPINFRVYKLNHSGFEIITKLKDEDFVTLANFTNVCKVEGVVLAEAEAFWAMCIESKLLVKSPNTMDSSLAS